VPTLRKAFCEGIPAKLRCSDEGQFLLLASSEVGVLNSVIELWRFDSAAACMRHREASRAQPAWQTAIASVAPLVQSFTTTLLVPTVESPMS
jgi:hypothetical protein